MDTVVHTRLPFVSIDSVLDASTEMAMQLPDGAPYWWGFIKEQDIYPTLQMLHNAPWDVAQDIMLFRNGSGSVVHHDTRRSWRALTVIKRQPEYLDILKAVKRIAMSGQSIEKQQAKLAELPWLEHPGCYRWITEVSEYALTSFL